MREIIVCALFYLMLDKVKYGRHNFSYRSLKPGNPFVGERKLMKIVTLIARYLLGFMFLVFGLNGFLHFIPQPPPSADLAGQYLTVLSQSHYLVFVFLLQFVAGVLLLVNRFVPLALVLLGPIIVNILLFHALMQPAGIAPGIVVLILWSLVFYRVRGAFRGIFAMREETVDGSRN